MNELRLAGAGMILGASLWAGLRAALLLRRTQAELTELAAALETVGAEIRCAAAPFAPLCRRAGEGCAGAVGRFFSLLAREGSRPDLALEGLTRRACREAGLLLPEPALKALERLFDGFGRWDREGQLAQLALAAGELDRLREELNGQLEGRCRSYRLLGLSAGAAVLVLLL